MSYYILLLVLVTNQKSDDWTTKALLLGLLSALALNLFVQFISNANLFGSYSIVIFSPLYASVLMVGPLLYAYSIRVSAGRNLLNQKYWWAHLIPALGALVAVYFLLFLYRNDNAQNDFQAIPASFFVIMRVLVDVQLIAYAFYSTQLIRKHQKSILEQYSNCEKVDLAWLAVLVLLVCAALIFGSLLELLFTAFSYPSGSVVDATFLVITACHFCIVFAGFSGVKYAANSVHELPAPNKYGKSSLSKENSAKIHSKLIKIMTDESAYLDSELTLRSLADMLSTNPHHLSQVINNEVGNSFYSYINDLRIRYALNLLDRQGSSMKVVDIAYACGYNNKASFYKAFKKHTGMTPVGYRKNCSPTAEKSL